MRQAAISSCPAFISFAWLDRLEAAMQRFIDQSRVIMPSPPAILLEPGHRPDNTRLRKIPKNGALDPDCAKFGLNGRIVDLAENLLSPNLKLHHSAPIERKAQ